MFFHPFHERVALLSIRSDNILKVKYVDFDEGIVFGSGRAT